MNNLATLPAHMRQLPVDERGYVVPWFVAWVNGKPEFRAADKSKFVRAIKEKLCWVCGSRLGVNLTFVAGPMCGINRTTSEPPCHRECAIWSAENCPFLLTPRMVRREDDFSLTVQDNVAGFGIRRNPGVAMLWHTRAYEVFKADGGGEGYLITMGEPDRVSWYSEGRPATRAEVVESIESGLPSLVAMAKTEPGALEHLDRARARFEKWLPNE
jgi:hypothetical protein